MIYGLYVVKDLSSDMFDIRLTTFASDRDAVFNFKKACSVPGTIMNLKPSDFMIYRVGSYDSTTGYVKQQKPEALDLSIIPDFQEVSKDDFGS